MKIALNSQEYKVMQKISGSKRVAYRLVTRAAMILLCSRCGNQCQTARQLHLPRGLVQRWVSRWNACSVERQRLLGDYEKGLLSEKLYEQQILEWLTDKPRSGTPAVFRQAERQQIIAMACESPAAFGLPLTHWTHELLSQQAKLQGIVDNISPSQVGRILKTYSLATP